MNSTEREAVILNAAWQMIDGMVNWGMFVKNDNLHRPTNLMFETRQHGILFAILLGDFLSQIRSFKGSPVPLGLKPVPPNARPRDLTFLFHLTQVCTDPHLGTEIKRLGEKVEEFAEWLECPFVARAVNFSAIDVVADLNVARYRYLKMCGDIAKHNLGRLATNVHYLGQLLLAAGHKISEQDAYLAVENFFDWFHNSIFIYHSSHIAEFLNDIRWEIFAYLLPEFRRSWHLRDDATKDFPIYGYKYPPELRDTLARSMYWDLMNRVRAKPRIPRFVVSPSFKELY